jgi:hypothetical protein
VELSFFLLFLVSHQFFQAVALGERVGGKEKRRMFPQTLAAPLPSLSFFPFPSAVDPSEAPFFCLLFFSIVFSFFPYLSHFPPARRGLAVLV